MSDATSNLRDKHKGNIKIIKDFVVKEKPELDKQTQEYLDLINKNTIQIANVLLQTNMTMKKKLVTLLRQAQKWDEGNTADKKEKEEEVKQKESDEYREKLKPEDLAVYIH